MKRGLSNYSFDELLLMPRAKMNKIIEESIADMRHILDPTGEFEGELIDNKPTKLIEKHYGQDYND